MRLLDPETVIAINRMTISMHGGMFIPPDNLRAGQNLGFVDQIRVNKLFGEILYPTPYHQAAAFLYYICKNHSFNDGNKRTGLACALTILEWNRLPVRKIGVDEGEAFMLSVATSSRDPGSEVERIATWLKPAARRPRSRTSKRKKR